MNFGVEKWCGPQRGFPDFCLFVRWKEESTNNKIRPGPCSSSSSSLGVIPSALAVIPVALWWSRGLPCDPRNTRMLHKLLQENPINKLEMQGKACNLQGPSKTRSWSKQSKWEGAWKTIVEFMCSLTLSLQNSSKLPVFSRSSFNLYIAENALLHHLSVGCGTFVHQLSHNMALTFPVRAANSVGDLDGVAGGARAVWSMWECTPGTFMFLASHPRLWVSARRLIGVLVCWYYWWLTFNTSNQLGCQINGHPQAQALTPFGQNNRRWCWGAIGTRGWVSLPDGFIMKHALFWISRLRENRLTTLLKTNGRNLRMMTKEERKLLHNHPFTGSPWGESFNLRRNFLKRNVCFHRLSSVGLRYLREIRPLQAFLGENLNVKVKPMLVARRKHYE